jgi:hypothetical protein
MNTLTDIEASLSQAGSYNQLVEGYKAMQEQKETTGELQAGMLLPMAFSKLPSLAKSAYAKTQSAIEKAPDIEKALTANLGKLGEKYSERIGEAKDILGGALEKGKALVSETAGKVADIAKQAGEGIINTSKRIVASATDMNPLQVLDEAKAQISSTVDDLLKSGGTPKQIYKAFRGTRDVLKKSVEKPEGISQEDFEKSIDDSFKNLITDRIAGRESTVLPEISKLTETGKKLILGESDAVVNSLEEHSANINTLLSGKANDLIETAKTRAKDVGDQLTSNLVEQKDVFSAFRGDQALTGEPVEAIKAKADAIFNQLSTPAEETLTNLQSVAQTGLQQSQEIANNAMKQTSQLLSDTQSQVEGKLADVSDAIENQGKAVMGAGSEAVSTLEGGLEAGKSIATDTASALEQVGKSAVADTVEAASGILDTLGPVGEAVGALADLGFGIYSAISGTETSTPDLSIPTLQIY